MNMICLQSSRYLQSNSAFSFLPLSASRASLPFKWRRGHPSGLLQELRCIGSSCSFSSTTPRPRSKTFDEYRKASGLKTQEDYMRLDRNNCSPNYQPTPVVITKGEGIYVWDTDGNKYFDFVAGISVRQLNQTNTQQQ